jgi:parallel beta-helix repeat protein
MRDNSGHGISVEISGHAVIAGNVIAGNGGNGIKINDTDNVELWNNTFVGNARPIAVLQDKRDVNPGGSYHDPNLPLSFQIRHITVANNILANPGSRSDCALCVQDYTHRFSAEALDIHANGNVYQRSSARTPSRLVLWSRGSASPGLFSTIPDFRSATGQEASHLALTGKRAVTRLFHPTAVVKRSAHQVALPLPADIAGASGRNTGARWLGAWFGA